MSDSILLPTNHLFKDLTGQRFGRLAVIAFAGRRGGRNRVAWTCHCDCGNSAVVLGEQLRAGKTTSCGCFKNSPESKHRTHGKSKTPEFRIWAGMIQRCTNPNVEAYPDYGGRGIVVSERWQSFENFLADMGQRPSRQHSIERKDVNGNYCPENCVWATQSMQSKNQRCRAKYTFNGKTMVLSDWAKELGVTLGMLSSRIYRGWPIEQVISVGRKR